MVSVKVACVPSDGSAADCDSIPVPTTLCEDTPFAMIFKYNGGDCEQSFNLQPSSLFSCQDFNGGPPTEEGEQSFVTVTDTKGMGITYFSDFVGVGGDFFVEDDGNNVADDMQVAIYSSADTSQETMLQAIVYHSSCSENLFLKDRFGSVQLTVFVNEKQGAVTCDFSVTYVFSVENVAEESDLILQTLESDTNIGLLNLTNEVNGVVVAPGNSATFERAVILDLTVRQRYTLDTTVMGLSRQSIGCSNDDFLSFEAGSPLPPSIPTSAPTSSPTTTPVPTPDPEDTSCDLLPLIECSVADGPPVQCNELQAPTQLTCLGNRSPYELAFVYNGGSCPGTNNASAFRCNDRNGGPSSRTEVWLLIQSNGETIFNQAVNQDNFIAARGSFDQVTDLTIFSIVNNEPGVVLQTMRLRTGCQEDDDLTLLTTFGALQLIGFANGPSGSQSILATVQIRYQVATLTGIHAVIQRAEANGAFAGQRVLRSTPSDPVGLRDILDLGIESKTINLAMTNTSTFQLIVNATSMPNPALACSATADLSFTVM